MASRLSDCSRSQKTFEIREMKRCASCHATKSAKQFFSRGVGLHSYCRACARQKTRVSQKRHAARHPEKVKAAKRQFRMRWPYKSLEYRLKHQYALTLFQFNELLLLQQNRCKICKEFMRPPCVDHCHTTGRVRGLLCDACNVGLGRFKDSMEILVAAIQHLSE